MSFLLKGRLAKANLPFNLYSFSGCDENLGEKSSGSEQRAKEFSLEVAKPLKRKSVDPFNASDQDNLGSFLFGGQICPPYGLLLKSFEPDLFLLYNFFKVSIRIGSLKLKKFTVIIFFLVCISLALPCFASNIDAKTYCDSGLNKFELENYSAAIEDYNKAIQLESNNCEAYVNRGRCKCALNDYDNAVQDFTNAIKINPYCSRAYSYRGQAKNILKNHIGCIDDCTKAIQLDPNAAFAYLSRSASKKNLGDLRGAKEDSQKFEELTPYFNLYIKDINKVVKSNWKPPYKKSGKIIVQFKLHKNGQISDIKLIQSSGNLMNDESAINILKQVSPFPPLPKEFQGNNLDIQFTFVIHAPFS